MSNKVSVIIIVVFVIGLLSFLVMAIKSFNETSIKKDKYELSQIDSIMMAKIDLLELAKDSLSKTIVQQEIKISVLNNNILHIRQNIKEISDNIK